jgi:sulfite reductase beta subunit-like hemoprotein
MTIDWQALRIEGIYKQPHEGFGMLRVKLPAGVLSAGQARGIAAIAAEFARGALHLTTRGSIELHWLREENLLTVKGRLAALGLTSRGACGGAVRGITCADQGSVGFPQVEALARRLQRHFTGNPRYERLPKKFKIGITADDHSRSHLIQDAGLVLKGEDAGKARYDVWIAGGLGREPLSGFLLEEQVVEGRIIPLIEAVLQVYGDHAQPGKRLKHMVQDLGQETLRKLIAEQPSAREELSPPAGLPDHFVPAADATTRLEAPVFAGELPADDLARLAGFAETRASGWLIITADQNIAFQVGDAAAARQELDRLGFGGTTREEQICFKICPGSHECRMGLAPTRDVARQVIAALGPVAGAARWAISGCHNSCAQPQLADYGIVVSGLMKSENGSRSPRFDLFLHSGGQEFGSSVARNLSLAELLDMVQKVG